MKILGMHDQHGNIRSLGIAVPSSGLQAALKPQEGHRITEVEAPDVRDEQDHEHLHAIREYFRIELDGGEPRLVRKKP